MEVHAKETNFMLEAVALARQASGLTAPNPMVGALVVDAAGNIIGRGFHPKAGQPHAEVFAIAEAKKSIESLNNCTLYVTLEPCNHFGKTPPCADLVISSGIKKVIVGSIDPNPLMQGKSFVKLRESGLAVEVGILKEECDKLIRGFRTTATLPRPYITLKCATSLDGKIATETGESKWITSEPARFLSHRERSEHDGILVGVGTLLADDPKLNVRGVNPSAPLKKIILDSRLRTPLNSQIFSDSGSVIIYCDKNYSSDRKTDLESKGARVIPVDKTTEGGLDLNQILKDLKDGQKVQELLVEGGAKVLGSFVQSRLFDRMLYFIAPKILGSKGKDVFEGLKVKALSEGPVLSNMKSQIVGADILIEGTMGACSQG